MLTDETFVKTGVMKRDHLIWRHPVLLTRTLTDADTRIVKNTSAVLILSLKIPSFAC